MARKLIHGWKRDSYDPADRRLHVGAAAPQPLADLTDLTNSPFMAPVWDQGENEGSCTGHGTGCAVVFATRAQGIALDMPSRQAIYYDARALEGTPDQDSGAEIRDAIQACVAGVGPESLWPYEPANMFTPPGPAYRAAAVHHALNYQRVAQADYYIGYALEYLQHPVVVGAEMYPAFESDAVAASGIVPLPGRRETSIGGHCFAVVGRDVARDEYICRNSWGAEWGLRGYFRMPRAYLLAPALASDFWVITQEN